MFINETMCPIFPENQTVTQAVSSQQEDPYEWIVKTLCCMLFAMIVGMLDRNYNQRH